ncbi:MAG TPA: histidinol dehydrogenase, partial [Actinomycetota bacterium]|nr:histidinol dehydrogenase [Actinomycetota bacterium]
MTSVTTHRLSGLRRLRLGEPADAARIAALTRRGAVPDPTIRDTVRSILADVRRHGAEAVRETNRRVGGGQASGELIVARRDLDAARDDLPGTVREALVTAIANVRRFAETQRPTSTTTVIGQGVEIERRWTPVASVGCYVPGGSAPYPSS